MGVVVEIEGIVPEDHQQPKEAVASFFGRFVLVTLVWAWEAVEAAFQVEEEDETYPLEAEAVVVSLMGSQKKEEEELGVAVGVPWEELEHLEAVVVEPPCHDASCDVDDSVPDALASVEEPTVEHQQTIDAVCLLDSKDSEQPEVSRQHFRVSLLSHLV